MRNRIGFATSWMKKEDSTVIEQIETVSNIQVAGTNISPAHIELLGRIEMTEQVITGESFSKIPSEKRREFLDELKWLVSINAQLGA